jgi:hypothetical protein
MEAASVAAISLMIKVIIKLCTHNNPIKDSRNLVTYPENYKYSSAKFYETGIDDPIAIGFGLLTHYKE